MRPKDAENKTRRLPKFSLILPFKRLSKTLRKLRLRLHLQQERQHLIKMLALRRLRLLALQSLETKSFRDRSNSRELKRRLRGLERLMSSKLLSSKKHSNKP